MALRTNDRPAKFLNHGNRGCGAGLHGCHQAVPHYGCNSFPDIRQSMRSALVSVWVIDKGEPDDRLYLTRFRNHASAGKSEKVTDAPVNALAAIPSADDKMEEPLSPPAARSLRRRLAIAQTALAAGLASLGACCVEGFAGAASMQGHHLDAPNSDDSQ